MSSPQVSWDATPQAPAAPNIKWDAPAAEEKSGKSVWQWLNTPIGDLISGKAGDTARAMLDHVLGPGASAKLEAVRQAPPTVKDSEHPIRYGITQGLAGAVQDTASTVAGATSPLSVGTAAIGGAAQIPGAIGKVANAATAATSAGLAAKGGADVLGAGLENSPEAWQKRFQGGAMMAGGAAGVAKSAPGVAADVAGIAKSAAPTLAQPVAKAAGFLSDVIDPEITGVLSPRLAHVQRSLGKLSEAIKQPEAAPAAETPTGTAPGLETAHESATRLTPEVRGKLQAILAKAESDTRAVIEQAAPKEAAPEAAAQATPLQKMQRSYTEARDDAAQAQESNWDLEKHGYRALSEERQQFFANNGPQLTKSQLATQTKVQGILEKAAQEAQSVLEEARIKATVPVKLTTTKLPKAPAVKSSSGTGLEATDDLSELLKRSIDIARKRGGGGS